MKQKPLCVLLILRMGLPDNRYKLILTGGTK